MALLAGILCRSRRMRSPAGTRSNEGISVKMEMTIPPELLKAIAVEVVAMLKPFLSRFLDASSKAGGEEVMGVPELCAYLGVSKDWVYGRTARNEIPFLKVGHLVKFRRSEIDRWLSIRSVPAVAPLSAPFPGKGPRDCESRAKEKTT